MSESRNSIKLTTSLIYVGLVGAASLVGYNLVERARDEIKGQDRFSKHLRDQQDKHPFFGMHEPLLPSQEQRNFFNQHFPEFKHLLPNNLSDLIKQQSLKTPVSFKSLDECPETYEHKHAKIVIVGGLPALMTAVSIAKQGMKLVYINDERSMPIAYGSAWHIEEDATSQFVSKKEYFSYDMLKNILQYEKYNVIEKTGYFSSRTYDWISWLKHPEQWFKLLRIALNQPSYSENTFQTISSQTKCNEKFFLSLNQELDGELLHQTPGAIFIARNKQERAHLLKMKESLEEKENRKLNVLTKEEIKKRYGFIPKGDAFFEKPHDRVLSANYSKIIKNYLKKSGNTVVNGTLTTIYKDSKTAGGMAEYLLPTGEKILTPFSEIFLSLGNQLILNENHQPLIDIISEKGVSMLAFLTVPPNFQLPPVSIVGEKNHLTVLSQKPILSDTGEHIYLVRMTAGACLTPTVYDDTSSRYDGRAALGLLETVSQTLGRKCKVDPIFVYGCSQQINQYGQSYWSVPYPDVGIQFGGDSMGLARSPDLAVKVENKFKFTL